MIQDAYLEAARRLPEYVREPGPMPLFLWLRYLTAQALQTLHRRHLGAQGRDAGREISIDGGRIPQATSAALAAQRLGHDTRASEAAVRPTEAPPRRGPQQHGLDRPRSAGAAALRATVQCRVRPLLKLSESAATKRYIRALRRLKETLTGLPGGAAESWR